MWKVSAACAAVFAVLAMCMTTAQTAATHRPTAKPTTAKPTPAPASPEAIQRVKNLKQTIESLSRQLMQQQTFVEERIRSDGMSGIKALRHIRGGTKPYFGDNHIGGSALSAHDHADYDRTIGLGEFVAVMNGVEFRTRHNDYKFRSATSSDKFNDIEDIPFPDVPPAVTQKHNVKDQIVEMREWFKAFKNQDHSVRDYRKYFKPNLCYLEGAWTLNSKTLDEPFQSDRHHIDATSWFDLQEKIRFTSYGGSKSNLENFAYLPTIMYNITDGVPQFAQWNYRILCHPLKQDVPTQYFEIQDDLSNRLAKKMTWAKQANQRAARYKLNEFGTDRYTNNAGTFLERLMEEIPGKDNYGANLTDDSFGLMNFDASKSGLVPLNVGYYHRWFKLGEKGAMGLSINHRGYHDENMWVAFTNQPNIMPLSIRHCVLKECSWATKRVSYAIPLEIVYSTPLSSWNPYNLYHQKNANFAQRGGRNGAHSADKAFNGTSFRHWYRTPSEFYKDGKTERDPADTARGSVSVLDQHGDMKLVSPTGFRVVTPEIQDVGKVRIRYPIFPVHSEGSTNGQEIMALKEMVMKMGRYSYLYEETPLGQDLPTDKNKRFHLHDSRKNPPGVHGHDLELTPDEVKSAMNGTDVSVTSSFSLGHQHELTVYYDAQHKMWKYRKCDNRPVCADLHSVNLDELRY